MTFVPEERPLAVYYEHEEWFRPLFAALEDRGIPYVGVRADEHRYDPAECEMPYRAVLNRMSPSAHLRDHGHAIGYTLAWLRHLERRGIRVVNGARAFSFEISKSRQVELFEELGVDYPAARVIHRPEDAPSAATGLRFPVIVKPDVGGSGAGIRRFNDAGDLDRAATNGEIDLGPSSVALVQELLPPEEGRIVRVEVLGGEVLYAIAVRATGESFNLCPADLCADPDDPGPPAEPLDPPPELARTATRILATAGIEVGGVEYLVDARDGRARFYDVNALSNFVADAVRLLDFDPYDRLAEWLEREAMR